MVSRKRMAISLGIVAAAAISLLVTSWAGARTRQEYPREQTLVTSGTQWGNIAGTNPYVGNYATGMVGLVNETLLRFDPLKGKYINWLAKSAKFTGAKTYVVVLRSGIKWSDGAALTPVDVAWNFKLGRFNTAFWNNLYTNLKSIKTPVTKTKVKVMRKGKCVKIVRKGKKVCKTKIKKVRNRVVFTFKGTPNYVQWQNLIWNLPIISRRQAADQIQGPRSLTTYSPANPVGTGPYKLDTEGYDATTRVVWKKKANWWAAKQKVSPSPKPRYVIDLVNSSNTNALSGLLNAVNDLNNNFLPGVETLVGNKQAQTYYSGPPYHLSANVAWLTPNTTHEPLNDPVFRKALAQSIDVAKIVNDDYHKLVLPSNSVGLLPIFSKWVATDLESSKGFSHNAAAAKAALQNAGYPLGGDGFFNKKGGGDIDLKIQVPSGWSDWEAARDIIISSAAEAGIKIHKVEKDFNGYQQDRNLGEFDLVVDNTYQMSDDPWTFFNGNFHLPIITGGTGQTFANFQRYENNAAWTAVQKLDKTPLNKTAARKALMRQLQDILLTDVPNIALWYNGVWAQMQSKYWTNWPADGTARKYVPCMWRGYLQMTGIDTITHVKAA